ncbi:PQQ-binding-like beta-propeller repeat protein [Actinomadura sp. NBRC 104412]|uniref:outer membrane protein assembly factor BamB family protein n=1 Tax=Actinomadura sp. NBRC 104412 TaxID=3032203 RepID=UPI002556C58C|nr:PQQ-binding-like beta-propeller repeat protein [Actinomadura sp. NBRC 104412]
MAAVIFMAAGAAGCSPSGDDHAGNARAWAGSGTNAVSRPVAGAGVAAVTGLRPDGTLETVAFDLATGARLWSHPATMVGRPAGMGVQPPAIAGPPGSGLVVAVEPPRTDRRLATLTARDARTGTERWTRPVSSTLGPARCGTDVCLSEATSMKESRFVALDPATGRARWATPGIAEVEHADPARIVLFRMTRRPSLEARHPRTGKALWKFPVDRALGRGVSFAGGWTFGVAPADDVLVGHMAPYKPRKRGRLSPYGFFGLRLSDGKPLWTRERMVRVYPSANPAVALFARSFTGRGGAGGFERIDPLTGRTMTTLPADRAPKPPWKLSFPPDLSTLGFVVQDRPGPAYRLRDGAKVTGGGTRGWTFCDLNPPPLKITGQRGFYPVASLCAYDISTGRRVTSPGAPPAWYTGSSGGWRVWRDERGALHGIHDTEGSAPGMYGM